MSGNAPDILSRKSQTSRCLDSWHKGYLTLTKNAPAPEIFKKWAAFYAIEAAMTCRTWIRTDQGIIYPNSMIILVGFPGIGKGPAIDPIERILHRIDTSQSTIEKYESIHMGPSDSTIAGLFDEFLDDKAQKTFKFDGNMYAFQNVCIVAEELSAFMHHVDMQMMGYLIKFLNCSRHSQRLRSKGETMVIDKPVLSILAGVQPAVLSHIFPPQAFGMGLTARTTFVYSDQKTKVSPFAAKNVDTDMENKLVHDLRRITRLVGQFKFTEEAQQKIESWWLYDADNDSQNHPKLEGYNVKRIFHLFRLCMVHSVSRSDLLVITGEDVDNAVADLLEVEAVMPNIFANMTGELSQSDVLGDLLHQIKAEYIRTKKPVPYHAVCRMAARKVKAYEIAGIVSTMVEQALLNEVTSGLKLPGVPQPKSYTPGDVNYA